MARTRSIVVRLRAEISDFQNKMGQASRSLTDFEKGQQKLGGAADTTMGRLVQSARINDQEWSTVGRTLAVAGGAITGLGVAALKTGTDYNTLQQRSRAALTTLTGSAEEANAQMDQLDDFAQNSPFAKQVFIEAQQQMLGFGIEAKKVIPYLGSIQDAVAATGGSNQDIAELTRIFSTIQSSAKITARDLMMFGDRGVDAAQLIGSQMGKTGAEIREEITAGTLDAGEALDALSAGMDERFGGAAANVKETFDGAVDRVKAAWRDLSSTLATPLVNPEGGGLLIDFFNMLADAMRGLEAAPAWLQGTIAAITGLIGVAALAGGTLMIALPRFVELRTAIETLSNTHPRLATFTTGLGKFLGTVGRMAGVGGLIAGVTIAAGGLIDTLRQGVEFPGVNQLSIDLMDLAEAGKSAAEIDLDDLLTEVPNIFGMATIEAENLGDVLDTVLNPSKTDHMADFFGNWLPSYMNDNREIVEGLDEALTHMLNAGGNQEAAAVEFMENLGYSAEELEQLLPGATDKLVEIEEAAAEADATSDALAGSFLGIGDSAEDAATAMENWLDIVSSGSESFGGILEAYDAVIEKQGETRESTTQTMDEWIEQLQAQAEAHANWAENVVTAIEQANEETTGEAQEMHKAFVEEMTEAGIEGAEALQTFVDATPEQRAELVEAWVGTKDDISDVIEAGENPQIEVELDTEPAITSHSELLDQITESLPIFGVDADTEPADNKFDGMLREWAEEETETNVDANVDPAKSTTRELFNEWVTSETQTGLDADSSKAQAEFNKQTYTWGGTTTDTNLDADSTPAEGVFQGVTGLWSTTTTATALSANNSPATGIFNSTTSGWRNTTTNTKIGADTSPAQSAWQTFKSSIGNITTSIFANFIPGNYEGGFINPGRYEGGQVLPGRQAGGRVPGPRAGRDNILWPLHSGGQVLSQPLEGGEFVVRSSQAPNYTQELYAMNNGTFPTGAMERLYSGNTGASSVTVTAPPVDTAAISAAVASAIRSYQPVVSIGGRQFTGLMVEHQKQAQSLGAR